MLSDEYLDELERMNAGLPFPCFTELIAQAKQANALRASRDKLEDALRDAMRAVAKLEARAALADEMYAWLCGPGQKDEWTNQQRHFVMRYTATKETT